MLGITQHAPKFSHNFLQSASSIQAAIADFSKAVKTQQFPSEQHSFF
jgi:ketopantoate hydroxymethyltransferase